MAVRIGASSSYAILVALRVHLVMSNFLAYSPYMLLMLWFDCRLFICLTHVNVSLIDKRTVSPCILHLDPVEGKHESFQDHVRR